MWIDVKERLPENDDMVIVCLSKCYNIKNSYIDFAYYENGNWTDENDNNKESNIDFWYVTYWQPLPELPR